MSSVLSSSVSQFEFVPLDEEQDTVSSSIDTTLSARSRAQVRAKRQRKGKANANPTVSDVYNLMLTQLPKLSKKELVKYAPGLVRNGFECRHTLKNAPVRNLQLAGMLRGHALLVHKTWDLDSNINAQSTSSFGSSIDDPRECFE